MEGKLSFSVARVPARRFAYFLYSGIPVDWNEGLHKVNQFVETIPTLSFAHAKTIISFNGQKDLISRAQLECKVGREIVGHYRIEGKADNGQEVLIEDGEVMECYRFSLGHIAPETFTFDKFFDLETELRRKTADFGKVYDNWRILIDNTANNEDSALTLEAEIQFFSENQIS